MSATTKGQFGQRVRIFKIVTLAALALGLFLLLLSLTLGISNDHGGDAAGLAEASFVRASSTAAGFSASSAVLVTSTETGHGWRSDDQTVGAWLSMSWPTPHVIRSVTIVRPLNVPGVTAGFLQFGDDSRIYVVLPPHRSALEVPITPRLVRSVRFTATAFSRGATAAEVHKFAVNDTAVAVVHDAVGDAVPHARTQLSGFVHSKESGGVWSAHHPTGATIRFVWAAPRELDQVELSGSLGSTSSIASATLKLNGDSIPVGGVPPSPEFPTRVAFMPRISTTVVFEIRTVTGPGAVDVSGIRLLEHGKAAEPVPSDPGGTVEPPLATSACANALTSSPTDQIKIACPENGSRVGDRVVVAAVLPRGANGATAETWPASGSPGPPPLHVTGSGVVRFNLNLTGTVDGPLTVRIEAGGTASRRVTVQLLHGRETGPSPISHNAGSLTLAYDEEFSGPRSVSRSGENAQYAGGKPERNGVVDFGSAEFADPSRGLGNVGVLDNRYLALRVQPAQSTQMPRGGGHSIGGMIASARPGGSGFAAQYGYFEARLLVPSAPGTWPAFWLLPSPNLVDQQPEVAEIDAVELYGHDPELACQSTHEYVSTRAKGISSCGQRFVSDQNASQWHVYGVDVTPAHVAFYVDGSRVALSPQVEGANSPMFFLVDLALGGGWPTDLTATDGRAQMLIDYVRVWV
jgi:hypothetical protein